MELTMLKDCWNNPQTWGLLFPTWSHQDGTKSLPSSSHPLSPIHWPLLFPKVSHHNLHPHHWLYFQSTLWLSQKLFGFSSHRLPCALESPVYSCFSRDIAGIICNIKWPILTFIGTVYRDSFIGTVLVLVLKNEHFVKFFIPILSQVIGTIKYSKIPSFCCCSY